MILQNQKSRGIGRQQGSVLAISLMILVVMTIIGLSGMQAVSLEERMAGNMRDRNLSFQAAETALRVGENSALPATGAGFNCQDGRYPANDVNCDRTTGTKPLWEEAVWAGGGSIPVEMAGSLAQSPRYIVEELIVGAPDPGESLDPSAPADSSIYRVTARGVGGTQAAVVVLQSTFRR